MRGMCGKGEKGRWRQRETEKKILKQRNRYRETDAPKEILSSYIILHYLPISIFNSWKLEAVEYIIPACTHSGPTVISLFNHRKK